VAPYQLDARKCISYATIELRSEEIPEPVRSNLDGWIFGCDICQDVCPWNCYSQTSEESRFEPREGITGPGLSELIDMTPAEFSKRFSGSAIKRSKHAGLRRNALAASWTDTR